MESKENEILVKVQNVSKKFSLDLKTSLKYGAVDILRSTFGMKTSKELRPHEFWAVKDISFELRRGECIGLIGHNGAGKSTLLKILNGLYAPDKGQITMKGKVGALIELGAGFNPILTGRENIYNNASILGFTRKEVEEKMQSIIDFAEIDQFLDMPVQNYSSGMKVRLGFAVAAHLEPDVLIIDEVLAVGDMGFALKCFAKIDELLPNTAVIFVSHSMPHVIRLCTKIILMNRGQVEYQGNEIGKGVLQYYSKFKANNEKTIFSDSTIEVSFIDISNNAKTVKYKDDIILLLDLKILYPRKRIISAVINIKDKEQRTIASIEPFKIELQENQTSAGVKIKILNSLFTLGYYSCDLIINQLEPIYTPVLRINDIVRFKADGANNNWVPILLETNTYS